MDRPPAAVLVNRYVVAAVVLQTLAYAALLAATSHGPVTPAVRAVRGLPTLALAALSVPAIPAVVLTAALGAVLAAVGVPPTGFDALLLTRGDVLFFPVAYLLAVAVGRRRSRRTA